MFQSRNSLHQLNRNISKSINNKQTKLVLPRLINPEQINKVNSDIINQIINKKVSKQHNSYSMCKHKQIIMQPLSQSTSNYIKSKSNQPLHKKNQISLHNFMINYLLRKNSISNVAPKQILQDKEVNKSKHKLDPSYAYKLNRNIKQKKKKALQYSLTPMDNAFNLTYRYVAQKQGSYRYIYQKQIPNQLKLQMIDS